jgi:hypothetical protein
LRTLPDRFRNSVRFTIMLSVVGIVAVISPPVITEAGGASGGWNSTNSVRLMADVNGDGREDIVGFGDAGVWTSLSTGAGFAPPVMAASNFGFNQGWRVDKHVRLVTDINGDHRADIVAFGDDGVWTALGQADGTFAPEHFVLKNFGVNQGWDPAKHVRLMADLNGDGKADIIAFGNDGVWTSLSNGDGSFQPEKFVLANFGLKQGWNPAVHVRLMADVNGDHKADIVAFGNDGVWTALSNGDGSFKPEKLVMAGFASAQGWTAAKHVRTMADLNGDGKADIVGFGNDGIATALSMGDGTFAPAVFAFSDFGVHQGWDPSKHVRIAADVNHDGKADVVAFGGPGTWILLGNGNGGFVGPPLFLENFGAAQSWDSTKHVRTAAGVSGDGTLGLVGFGDAGVWFAPVSSKGVAAGPFFVLPDFGFLTPKAMDVVPSADGFDANNLPLNPTWRALAETGQPPDADKVCPTFTAQSLQNSDPNSWRQAANCTNQSLEWDSGEVCGGHMDWFPVAYEGRVMWGAHSTGLFDDTDYYFYLHRETPEFRSDKALYVTARDGVELEFNADETVENWDGTNTWWEKVHNGVGGTDGQNLAVEGWVNGNRTIVVGRMGVDTYPHGGHADTHTEIHPAYAMFVQTDGAQTQLGVEHWAFFVRNSGDEGGCASGQKRLKLPGNIMRIFISHQQTIGGTLDAANTWTYGDNQDEARKQGWSYQFVPGGLMLTFGLSDPGKEVGMMGDLTIRWQTAGVIPLPTLTGGQELLRLLSAKPVAENQVDQEEGDPQLLQKFAKLSAADRKVFVDRQRAAAVPVHHAKPVRIAPTQTLNSASRATAVPTEMLDHGKMVESAPESQEQQTADANKRAAAESYLKELGVQPVTPPTPPSATVPDVSELSPTLAQKAILAAGLVPKFTGPNTNKSWVLSQSPAAGRTVAPGSTVTMVLSTAPPR